LEAFFFCCCCVPPLWDLVSEPEPLELEPSELEPVSPLVPPLAVPPFALPAPAEDLDALAGATAGALLTPGSGWKGLRAGPPTVCSAAPLVVSATEVFVLAAAVTAIPEAFGAAMGALAAGTELDPPAIAA
jgi:hypothetical protein